jgi:hypothetical protein
MLQIIALKLEINTTNGLYGTTIPFTNGLNIIRANNTSGKSTIFQSIAYALGLEEIIGGKYEKTMQSVLKDSVVDGEASHKVLQSSVTLEIFNGSQTITVRRSVINERRKSQLVDVYSGGFISDPNANLSLRQMYVHDKGAATDELYGFHAYLEEFLGWKLPNVVESNGARTKLYLPLIAPAFIIEQKSGWSSFFATMPFYNIRNAEERVIEFLLNLDVFQNEQSKVSLSIEKRILQEKWTTLYNEFKRIGYKGNAEVVGMSESPSIINSLSEVYFRILKNEKTYLVHQIIEELQTEYEQISKDTEITVGDNVEKNQIRLQELSDNLSRYNYRYEKLKNEVFQEKEKLKQYIIQKKEVADSLANNKSAQKMLKLGADIQSPLASNMCPTCGQGIKDILLPEEVEQVPMKIDENINFLTSQFKMIEVFVNSQRKQVIEKESIISQYDTYLSQLRAQIRSIKRDLVSDDRIPSEDLIERKINTRKLVKFYEDMADDIDELKKQLSALSKEWEAIKKSEASLSGNFFSSADADKINFLENYFLQLMKKFNYQSKEKDAIKISKEKYLPVIEVTLPNEKPKNYDIRFDSSGSDHIRCMWSYYVALLATSNAKKGNHPQLLLFDEPQQQSASTNDFHEFLKELSTFKGAQTIVFASFQNSVEDFKQATKGLAFNKIERDGKFIYKLDTPIQSN